MRTVEHGTRTMYNREVREGRLPCQACTQANTAYAEARRREAGMRAQADISAVNTGPPHGTVSRYTSKRWRCRCPECRQANNRYARERRRARASAG